MSLVSIEEARKKLRPKYEHLSDEQVKEIIEELNTLSKIVTTQLPRTAIKQSK